jgi:hypothetical protein
MTRQSRGKTRDILVKAGILGELLRFLWRRKLWWMIPMVLMLLLLATLIVFGQGSAVAPFIYSLF